MYPGVLILEFTDSEVLAPSRRSTLKGINAVLRRDCLNAYRGREATPSVPGMGQNLLPERRQPEEVTITVVKRKGEAVRPA